jgi:hypothetical protein
MPYPNCRNPFLPIVEVEIAPQFCFTPQTVNASEYHNEDAIIYVWPDQAVCSNA